MYVYSTGHFFQLYAVLREKLKDKYMAQDSVTATSRFVVIMYEKSCL